MPCQLATPEDKRRALAQTPAHLTERNLLFDCQNRWKSSEFYTSGQKTKKKEKKRENEVYIHTTFSTVTDQKQKSNN